VKNFNRKFKVDELEVLVFETSLELAHYASWQAESLLNKILTESSSDVGVILATGNSQLEFLEHWTSASQIDWQKVTLFHMDEYLGISDQHPASFRKYMKTRVESLLQPKKFEYLTGDSLEPISECDRYEVELRKRQISLCCLGIGENGHLAFNDPPVANFNDKRWVKVVQLDEACRNQQVGEGHFPSLEQTPQYALTLTIPALLNAEQMICICPEERKAKAVQAALTGPISTDCPASILRTKPNSKLLLDSGSASLLEL
jgi:glucosamine-6-phosphate deaminase